MSFLFVSKYLNSKQQTDAIKIRFYILIEEESYYKLIKKYVVFLQLMVNKLQ